MGKEYIGTMEKENFFISYLDIDQIRSLLNYLQAENSKYPVCLDIPSHMKEKTVNDLLESIENLYGERFIFELQLKERKLHIDKIEEDDTSSSSHPPPPPPSPSCH